MAKFIRSKFNKETVNLDLVVYLRKSQSNLGLNIFYYISFFGTEASWRYESREDRDKEFERIMYLFGYDL
jgi:hypothetical protein